MPWVMEVKIKLPDGSSDWRAVRSSGPSGPYTYDTREEAEAMLRICYPEQTRDQARTRELTAAEE